MYSSILVVKEIVTIQFPHDLYHKITYNHIYNDENNEQIKVLVYDNFFLILQFIQLKVLRVSIGLHIFPNYWQF